MLASFPASILNQIPPESGNPLDSIKKQDALAKTERAARERWPSYERFWAPFRPGGSRYKPHLTAATEADEEGMGCA
jgi:hypothetical protein